MIEPRSLRRSAPHRGFTMVELMITLTVLAAVMVVLMTVIYAAQRSKITTANRVESAQSARVALEMMTRDLRSAGYRADEDYLALPQPPIAYIDSLQVLINADLRPYPDSLPNILPGIPAAYAPTGNPKPYPLNATAWQPPIKYRTGAEVIRWTLDVNNDGKVDSLDWTAPNGLDAQRTPNRNDYVLVRQVYGDSTAGLAGFNGGATDRVALIQRPVANGVAPMFKVYLQGSATPYDWSNGPVPANQLNRIERIVVSVTSSSARPDGRGGYASTVLTTEVNSMRNVPNFGATLYAVDGFVYNDANKNGSRDGGESGIAGATVRTTSGLTQTTEATGYYVFRLPAGTYTLKHTPAHGFGNFNSPDSFVVTVPPATSRSFADTVASGGWVSSFAYWDVNGDRIYEAAIDTILQVLKVTSNPGNDVEYTNSSGYATNFVPTGAYSVTATPPDSFVCTTSNPVTGTMTNGGSASASFAFSKSGMGTFKGTVFIDANRNGTREGGEAGIPGVWVGVTPDAGITVLGWQYTDANGAYSITVPERHSPDPAYYVMTVVKSGYFPTSTTTAGPYYLNNGQTIQNVDFGEVGYQVITLNASRVLSLAAIDLIEGDWNGSHTENAHGDVDLVLGADATGTDQISTWFNQYDSSPLFTPNPTRSYTAQQSVMSIACDTLDNTATFRRRPDVATGTKNALGGNFFIWLNQNSNNNEGYLPANASLSYRTLDGGDVQSILTYDCAGGLMPDIIVGTKSPTANQGTIEVWQNNDLAAPTFSRVEIYPPAGAIPNNTLGEVTAMALADFDGDGVRDLVVGTKTGLNQGQLLFFKLVSKITGARFVYQCGYKLDNDAVTSLACMDVDGDGKMDVVVGTQSGLSTGNIMTWGNHGLASLWSFSMDRSVNAPGIVMTLAAGDFGGTTRKDLVVGYRADAASFLGGVRIYYNDTGRIPNNGTDPSAGSVVNMVPAVATANFNYGVYPATPAPPYLMDLAAGVKITASTGALVVYIR